jgi:hypothetical protein
MVERVATAPPHGNGRVGAWPGTLGSSTMDDGDIGKSNGEQRSSLGAYIACAMPSGLPNAIQTAIAIIIKFSVSDTNPSGTVLLPPTHAHFSSRRSM